MTELENSFVNKMVQFMLSERYWHAQGGWVYDIQSAEAKPIELIKALYFYLSARDTKVRLYNEFLEGA